MPVRRKLLILAAAIAIFFAIAIAFSVALFFSPLLTRYVESDGFRVAMEKETAKGLHFPQGGYAAIQRTGAFTAQSDSFLGRYLRHAARGAGAERCVQRHRVRNG